MNESNDDKRKTTVVILRGLGLAGWWLVERT